MDLTSNLQQCIWTPEKIFLLWLCMYTIEVKSNWYVSHFLNIACFYDRPFREPKYSILALLSIQHIETYMQPLCSSIWFAEESWCCILSSLQVQNLHKKQLNLGLCSSLVCIAMRCYCELYSALMWELYKLKQWNSLIKAGRNATSSSFLA